MRLPFRGAFAAAISLVGLVVLLVVLRGVQQPAPVTVVEREVHGRVDMSLGFDRWSIDGFGEVAREALPDGSDGSGLLLRRPAGAHIAAERHFAALDRAALAFSFMPDGSDARFELGTRNVSGSSLAVAFDPDGRVRLKEGEAWTAIGRFDASGWNSVYLAWDAWAGSLAYTLRVRDVALLDRHKIDGPRNISTLKFTLLETPTPTADPEAQPKEVPPSAWMLSGLTMASGLHFDFGRLDAGETVRVTGLDDRAIGESSARLRPLAETTAPFQILALDGTPEDVPVRFQLLRDGVAVADPSAIVFDARPGDTYRLSTAWAVDRVAAGDHGLWPLAMLASIAVAMLAYLALAPRLNVASGSIAVLLFAAARVLATEIPAGLGLAINELELVLLAAVAMGPAIVVGRRRITDRIRAALGWSRKRTLLGVAAAAAIVAIAVGSALAVAATPATTDAAHAAYVGHRWLQHGEAPYGDQWAVGMPGLYLANGLLADVFGHGANALLAARLTVLIVAAGLAGRLGHRLGGRWGAAAAGLTLAIAGSWAALGAESPSAPMVAAIPVLAALLAMHAGREHDDRGADLAAGALLAVAATVDLQAMLVVPVAALWVWPAPSQVAPWPRVARIALGAVIVAGLTAVYLVGRGVTLDAIDLIVVERARLAELWLATNALPVDPGWAYIFWVPPSVAAAYGVVAVAIGFLLLRRAWWPAAVVATALVAQHIAVKLVYRFEPADYYPFVWILALALAFVASQRVPSFRWAGPAGAAFGLASLGGVFVAPDQFGATTSDERDALDAQAPDLVETISSLTPEGTHVFSWFDLTRVLWLSDVATAGGFGRPSSAATVPDRSSRWFEAIRTDLPDVLLAPAGFSSAELRILQGELGYQPLPSGASAIDIYVRRPPVTGIVHKSGTCDGGSELTVGGLAPRDIVRLVDGTGTLAAAAAGTGEHFATLRLADRATNVRLELVHPRTLATIWVSDAFDRLCAGDQLALLAALRS